MSEQIGEEAALSRIVDGLPLDRPEVDWLARWGNAGFATVVTRLLEATGWFHAHLGLHRDISPANMMIGLDPDGSPRPCLLDPSSRENSALFGSIFVMSPEQFDRRPLDARSDLYSLGITLYFAASGRFPFYGDTAIALALAHLHDLPDLSPLARLPAAWAKWLTTRLMAKKPGDRPDSATHAWCEWMRLAGGNQAGHWRGVL
jgi:serine/threonine protein kinase